MTMPFIPGGALSDASLTSPAFSPKIALSSFSSGVGFRLALGRDLADQDVAFEDLGADPDDPVLVEVLHGLLAHVRDLPRQLLLAALGVADLEVELLDVQRGEGVLRHGALVDDDGVLEVVAAPRHERHEHVPAEGQFAVVRGAAVGQDVALLEFLPGLDDGALVDRGVLVRPEELDELVRDPLLVLEAREGLVAHVVDVVVDDDRVGVDVLHRSVALGDHHGAGVARDLLLHARAHDRRLGPEQRDRLALHVRSHQGAVGVVVLQERDEGRGGRDDLVRRHVHVLDLLRLGHRVLGLQPRLDLLVGEFALLVERSRSPARWCRCPPSRRSGTRCLSETFPPFAVR